MTVNPGEREPAELSDTDARPPGRIPADTFSIRLLLARTLAGMTIQEAAEAAGVKRSSWSNWEKGMRPRDILEVAQRIAERLDIDEQWLLFGGPLTGSRGRPVQRDATNQYAEASGVRPPDRRPPGHPGLTGPSDGSRRPRRRKGLESLPPLTLAG